MSLRVCDFSFVADAGSVGHEEITASPRRKSRSRRAHNSRRSRRTGHAQFERPPSFCCLPTPSLRDWHLRVGVTTRRVVPRLTSSPRSEFEFNTFLLFAPEFLLYEIVPFLGLHADRTARRDRDHRDPDCAAAPRRPAGPRVGPQDGVPQQPQADRSRPAQLRIRARRLPPRLHVPRRSSRHASASEPRRL